MTAQGKSSDRFSDVEDDRHQVGQAIRTARREAGLTLADVSQRSGVPLATISRIERGLSGGSFDKITKIASALGRSFDEITQSKEAAPALGRHAVTKSGDGQFFFNDRYSYEVHAGTLRKKAIIPLHMLVVTPNPPQRPEDWTSHDGEEFIYVVEGRVTVYTDLYEPVTLGVGDSIYIDSTMPHAFSTATEDGTPSRMLSVCMSADFSDLVAGRRPEV